MPDDVAKDRFPARLDAAREMCDFAVREAVKRGLAKSRGDGLRLAVEEAVVNICRYAYGEAEGSLEIAVGRESGSVVVRMIDEGRPFNPVAAEKPDVARSIREGRGGGLGIHLMKCMADGVSYRRGRGRNVLTLIFAKSRRGSHDAR